MLPSSRIRRLRTIVRFQRLFDRSFGLAPIAGVAVMAFIAAAMFAGAAALEMYFAMALVGIVVGFFGLIGAHFLLAGVIGLCRARRDGFFVIGLVRFALACAIGAVFIVSGALAVWKFLGQ